VIYRAIVADVRDPVNRGRVKVMIPAITGQSISDWIWPVVTGGYLVPASPGDQVWVLCENGDTDTPVWIGQTQPSNGWDLQARLESLESRVSALESAVFD
jgi:hypothetical protein